MAVHTPVPSPTVAELAQSSKRSLSANAKFSRTVRRYVDAAGFFSRYLWDVGMHEAVTGSAEST